jgi:hypothetical protein
MLSMDPGVRRDDGGFEVAVKDDYSACEPLSPQFA